MNHRLQKDINFALSILYTYFFNSAVWSGSTLTIHLYVIGLCRQGLPSLVVAGLFSFEF
jgi:hypothetical protein